jgi:hypothetical protein
MSSHKTDLDLTTNDSLDHLIRWSLHFSVAEAQPSDAVWERIQQKVTVEMEADAPPTGMSARLKLWLKRLLQGWVAGLETPPPTVSDPLLQWHRQNHAMDQRTLRMGVSVIEGNLPVLRLVS